MSVVEGAVAVESLAMLTVVVVDRYPGQEYMPASSKVPTIICYDKQGNPRAAGAEVFLPENVDLAETEEWLRVEWFVVSVLSSRAH